MRIHILGICGTFMGGIALLARQMGYEVSGSDANVYPPMSTMLEEQGIEIKEGYEPSHLDPAPDWVVIGNAMSRGNAAVEYTLDRNLPYISGPQFLADYVIRDRWVLAVAGTHGKTTTTSMLAWILEYAKLAPGFLVGGVPGNFGLSARLGDAPFFVVEADEYDTAFFDKRSKFIHYRPRTLIMNNLEFDHADIFDDLEAIKRQFHHLVRTVPGNGLIVAPHSDKNLEDVVSRGCWTPLEYVKGAQQEKEAEPAWSVKLIEEDGSAFSVYWGDAHLGDVHWNMLGMHNVYNGLAAIAAARHAGVIADQAVAALNEFKGIKRRMELRGEVRGVKVYDDFAHHPTAITTTLDGIRQRVGDARIFVAFEARSNTMKMGVHRASLAQSFAKADKVMFLQPPELDWSMEEITKDMSGRGYVCDDVDTIVQQLVAQVNSGDHIVVMSNGGFGGIHQKLLSALEQA